MDFIKPFDLDYREAISNDYTSAGNKFEPIYHRKYNSDGTHKIEVIGETNLVERIRSNAAACDVTNLIKKYALTGDVSFLTKTNGAFVDVTDVPNNFIDAYNLMEDLKSKFAKLPLSVREEYGSDIGKFLADLQTANTTVESEETENAGE